MSHLAILYMYIYIIYILDPLRNQPLLIKVGGVGSGSAHSHLEFLEHI